MKKTMLTSLILSMVLYVIISPFLKKLVIYLHPIALVVVLFSMVLAIFLLVVFIRKEFIALPSTHFRLIVLLYSFALLILLFFRPNDQIYQSVNLIPFSTIAFYFSGKVNGVISFYNLAGNIGLFIPFGLFLLVKVRSPYQLFFLPFLFISLIELVQYFTKRGSLDIDDLILNVLGFFIGYLVYPLFNRIFKVNE